MKKANVLIGVVSFAVLAVIILYRNDRIRACAKVRIGDDKETVRRLLGEHYRVDTIMDKPGWHLYESNWAAGGPIRILIEDSTQRVSAIRCSEDGPIVH